MSAPISSFNYKTVPTEDPNVFQIKYKALEYTGKDKPLPFTLPIPGKKQEKLFWGIKGNYYVNKASINDFDPSIQEMVYINGGDLKRFYRTEIKYALPNQTLIKKRLDEETRNMAKLILSHNLNVMRGLEILIDQFKV